MRGLWANVISSPFRPRHHVQAPQNTVALLFLYAILLCPSFLSGKTTDDILEVTDMKNFLAISVIVFVLLIGGVWWSRSMQSDDPTIISRNGLHWHPELKIFVGGEEIEIPENKGIETLPHSPIHTHDDLPIIHLEFGGLVREDNIRLDKWFEVWGRDMNFFGTSVSMTVNGVENAELGNYIMHDGDKIELRYE